MGQTQSITVTRVCDNCGVIVALVQPVTPEQLQAACGWYTVIKEHLIGEEIAPLAKIACNKNCAIELLTNDALELPAAAQDATFERREFYGDKPTSIHKVN